MGQNLAIICNRCKLITFFRCRFYNINKKNVQFYLLQHKGHEIRMCGDDSGWGLVFDSLEAEGFTCESFIEKGGT